MTIYNVTGHRADGFVAHANITDASLTEVQTSVAGKRGFITDVLIANSSSTTDGVGYLMSGSATLAIIPLNKNGGGLAHSFGTPLPCAVGDSIKTQMSVSGLAVAITIAGYFRAD